MAISTEIVESLLGIPCRPVESGAELPPGRIDTREVVSHIAKLMISEVIGQPGKILSADAAQAVTARYAPEITLLTQQAVIAERFANADLTLLATPDDPAGKRGAAARARYQGVMMDAIGRHTSTLPRDRLPQTLNVTSLGAIFKDSMLGIAPPGAGKTFIAAKTLVLAGINNDPANERFPAPTASIIVPDVSLVLQYLGKRGDNLFRRVIGEKVPVTAMGGDFRDGSGRVVVMSRQMLALNQEARERIKDSDFVIFDEGHHGLGPKMRELQGKLGYRTLYLTGTPAYVEDRDDRDLRKSVTYVEVGTPRQFAEEGITSPVQLLSFISDGTNESQLAAGLAAQMIKENRRVVVYCRPGDESQQAKDIANMINEKLEADVARAIGTFKGKESQDDIATFEDEEGDVKALTTVKMLREGASIAGIDAVIIMPGISLLDLAQKAGRGTRHGNQISIIAEILPPPKPGRRIGSIWQVYDFDEIPDGGTAIIGNISELLAGDTLPLSTRRSERANPHATIHPGSSLLSSLPPELKKALAPKGALRDVLVAPEDRARREPPPGYHSLDELAARFEVPVRWLQLYLTTKHNFASVDIITQTDDERRFAYVRWYEPAALAHLEKNPPPKLATEDFATRGDIRAMTGLSYDFIDRIISEIESIGEERLSRKRSKKVPHFNAHELAQILEKIDKIPQAESTDVIWSHLAREVGHSFINSCSKRLGITPIYKRRHPDHGVQGFAEHVSEDNAARIRQDRENLRPPTDDEISLIEVARLAQVSGQDVVRHNMTASEKEQIEPRRVTSARAHHDVDHIPRVLGVEIAERLRPVHLMPHLVPLSAMAAILQTSKTGILNHLKGTSHEAPAARIRLVGYPVAAMSCYTWSAMAFLEHEKNVRRRAEAVVIDYSRLVRGKDDTDRARWDYSRAILAQYIRPASLASRPEHIAASQIMREFDCTAATLEVIIASAQPTQQERTLLRSHKITTSLLERMREWLNANQEDVTVRGWGKKPPSILIQGGRVVRLINSEEPDESDDDSDNLDDDLLDE